MEELNACLRPEDELVLPHHRRAFLEYAQDEQSLLVHYRELEIEFDEPELFGFARQLIAQERFVAETATGWGAGYSWPRVSELLAALLERGVLKRAGEYAAPGQRSSGPLPSPLPAAPCSTPRTWLECEQLSFELTGRSVELAHLELLVPLHRVAHCALDREGRQVGEASVFPPQLRLDVPTEWRSCQYPGSRYQDEYPLNASALKSMQQCWRPLLTLMDRARALYLQRFPSAQAGFSLLDAHLFACLLMGLPAYALQRARQPVANGQLHPVLSSLARLADGARMTANELLTADTLYSPIDGKGLHDAAERTNLFLSTYGVCAGSRKAVDTFLGRFAEGVAQQSSDALDSELEAFCDELDPAFDYGLHAVCGYAVASHAWALVSETYERLHAALRDEPATPLAARIEADWKLMAAALGSGWLRAQHRCLYAGMREHAAAGLPAESSRSQPASASVQETVRSAFHGFAAAGQLTEIVLEHLRQEQLLIAEAELCQARASACLGRAPARLPLRADLLFLGHRLRHPAARLPYVMDALRDELGLRIAVNASAIALETA